VANIRVFVYSEFNLPTLTLSDKIYLFGNILKVVSDTYFIAASYVRLFIALIFLQQLKLPCDWLYIRVSTQYSEQSCVHQSTI
jgi:hypothetical protein